MSRVRFPGFLTGTWTELDGTGRNWTELDGTLSRVRFPGFVTGTWTELDGTGRNWTELVEMYKLTATQFDT
jgi:hypothetical protein